MATPIAPTSSTVQQPVSFQVPVALHGSLAKIDERLAKIGETSGATVNVHGDTLGFSTGSSANAYQFSGDVTGSSSAVATALAGIEAVAKQFS
jgi:hypothetical protein